MDGIKNWVLSRAGILDYWYYDEEYFDFCDGRMLLRGQNGSGKSVTMQSFIPLLLDGKRSPERLDPFNSKARKLEDYLLGEFEVNGKDSGTGYLFLEFKRQDEEIYASIGMGMKGKRGQGITDIWYFWLNDGRRIGMDFFLYECIDDIKVALSKRKLENLIGDGGRVLSSQQEYASDVNKLLFGYGNVEDFEDMVDLIVKIRTPKLSRDLNPSKIYDIMQSSLPGLTEEDLRPLSDTIENLDNLQTRLNGMKDCLSAALGLKREYDRYNKYMVYEKIRKYIDIKNLLYEKNNDIKRMESELKKDAAELDAIVRNIEDLNNEESMLKIRQEQLKEKEEYKLSEKLALEKRELQEQNEKKDQKEAIRYSKNSSYNRELSEKKELESTIYNIEKSINEYIDEASAICSDVRLDHHIELLGHILSGAVDLEMLKKESKQYSQRIRAVSEKLEKAHRLEEEHSGLVMEKDKLFKDKDFLTGEIEQVELQIEEAKNMLKERISAYSKENAYFKLSKDDEINLFQRINRIEGINGRNSLFDILIRVKNDILSDFTRKKEIARAQIGLLQNEIQKVKDRMQEVKAMEEKLFPTDELKLKARERLSSLNIPYIPFYMAVEFKDGVDEKMKDLIEQGLLDLGVLDSLIVPEKYRYVLKDLASDVKESIIFSNPRLMSQNMEVYLTPGSFDAAGITKQDVADAIASIGLNADKNGAYLCEDGTFGMGIIVGKTSSIRPSRYIGIESRKRYREQLLNELKVRLLALEEELSKNVREVKNIDEAIACLNEEYDRFPDFKDLDAAFALYFEYNDRLKEICGNIEKIENEIKKLQNRMALLREEISELSKGINLVLKRDVYDDALSDMDEYLDVLDKIDRNYINRQSKKELLEKTRDNIERLEEDLDLIIQEIRDTEREIEFHKKTITEIENALKNKDVDEIKKEIERCIFRLNEIPSILKTLDSNKEKLIIKNTRQSTILDERKQEAAVLKQNLENAYAVLNDELSLGFVVKYDEVKEDIEGFVRSSIKEYDDLFRGNPGMRDEMHHKLEEEVRKYQSGLIDYTPNIELKEYRAGSARIFITFNIEGKMESLYKLIDILNGSISECELLIQQEDRKLFEDTLTNSIGGKISAKIRKAKRWIDNMNTIMKGMDTSSGLEFHLKWEARSPESDDELHTSELVNLLEMDPRTIKDSDIKKITGHFKARIEKARKYRDDGQDYSALHMIMKDILDYRQWFEFKLYYQKTGESRRELSNNAYDRFSGGEKALSMYVPLLASLYAKYSSARQDAPKIIAMDEAFAGVDENNIEKMFGLIESLNFNFIMNSQALWGDYKTVPGLSIYELIRDKNSSTVLKVKYIWNGNEKKLVGLE